MITELRDKIAEFYNVEPWEVDTVVHGNKKKNRMWARRCFSFILYNFTEMSTSEIQKITGAGDSLVYQDIMNFTELYMTDPEAKLDVSNIIEGIL